jgi:UDP-4-amino-4-deoxy-L-arabinose-oxoglutarate aminotransferase
VVTAVTDWKVPYYRHDLGEAELRSLARVLAGDILTTGAATAEFESRFARLLGRRHALGVMSCTGAMHMALLALGIGPGDEVITTPMSFIATSTAILEAGATPVFVDCEGDTGNIDAGKLEAAIGPKTRALLPVHLYGQMCDMRALRAIADRHGLAIIEDSAHCVEGMRDGIRPGGLAEAACFSFYATKNLTCGEGGAIVCDDDALVERLRLLRVHGMTKTGYDRAREGYSHWDMALLGWKYNMSNIEAALLLPQFDRISPKLARRHSLAKRYEAHLSGIPGIRLPATRPNTVHARHVFTVWIENADRDWVMAELKSERIGAVVNYRPIHLTSYFRQRFGYRAGMYPTAERIGARTISLPFYPDMTDQQVDIVADALHRIMSPKRIAANG